MSPVIYTRFLMIPISPKRMLGTPTPTKLGPYDYHMMAVGSYCFGGFGATKILLIFVQIALVPRNIPTLVRRLFVPTPLDPEPL